MRIDARDSQTLRVTWQAPPANQQNGDIIGYKVHFAPDASNVGVNEAQVIDVTDAEQRATDIGGLGKFTSYKIWVLAYTIKGDGPTSPLQVARTDEDGKPGLGGRTQRSRDRLIIRIIGICQSQPPDLLPA